VQRRLTARRKAARLRFIVALIVVLIAAGVYTYSKDMYPWNKLQSIELKSVTFLVNGTPKVVKNGGELELSTDDTLQLSHVDTNAPFEFGVKVWSDMFPVEAIKQGIRVDQALLNGDDLLTNGGKILALYHRTPVGAIKVVVKPTKLFWIKRAAAAESDKKKIEYLKKAESLDPDSILLKIQLAKLLEDDGRLNDAITYYEAVSQKDTRPVWLDKLVELYRKSGRKEALDRIFAQRAKLQPTEENILEAAKFAVETKDWNRAAQYYEKLVSIVPAEERAKILKKLGFVYVSAGDMDKGIQAYEKALAQDPQDLNLYYNLAELQRTNKNLKKYAEYLEKALEIDPTDKKSRIRLINFYEDNKDYTNEARHINYLLERDPDNTALIKKLAFIYDKLGQEDQLIKQYEKLVKLEPQNKIVMYNLGVIKLKQKDLKGAESNMKNYLALAPEDVEAHSILFGIYQKNGDKKNAIEEAKKILALNPENLDMYDYLFQELSDRPNNDELVQILKTGVEKNPAAIQLREYLGLIYMEKNNVKGAIDQFKNMIRLDPKNIKALYLLAKLYESTSDSNAALNFYKQVLELDDGYKDARESYIRLSMEKVKEKAK